MPYRYIAITPRPAPLDEITSDDSAYTVGVIAETRLANAAPELLAALRSMTFVVETVAHLRGLERELLGATDDARALMATLEAPALPDDTPRNLADALGSAEAANTPQSRPQQRPEVATSDRVAIHKVTTRALKNAERELLAATVSLAKIRDLATVARSLNLNTERANVMLGAIADTANAAVLETIYNGVTLNG
jgi:hypothetical protein